MHAHLFSGVHVASLPTGSGFDEVSAPLADSAQAEARLFLWLANGVTTVRNMDFYNKEFGRQALQFRARAAAGESWIPRIYTAGPWGPVQYIGVDSIDEIVGQRDSDNPPVLDSVARYIAAYKAAGYDFVKVHEEKPDILDSVLAAAKRVGIPVAGHVPPPVNVEHAISIGYTSIEHTLSDYLWNGRTRWNPRDSSGIRVLAAAMRRAGVWNCPTQSHYDRLHYNMLYSNYPQILKVLQDSGVKLLLGTDELPRLGVITRELQELVTGGLTPYQALLTGTRNPAVYFGTLDQSGTIAVGKRADLVLLTGNPLQDVHYTAQPAGVMLGGRWLPRAEIDRRVALLKLPTFVSGNDEAQYAPVKSYWQNVLDDEVAATASLLYDIAVDDSQRTKYQALQIAHKAQRQALVDSLGTSNQYAADAQRIFRLLAQQLGEDRLEVPLDERPTFDSTARVWMQRRKTEGHAVAIPGV
jgi:imidazolonepropionase-like amidohydrolase